MLARYAAALPVPPAVIDWGRNVASWPMACNDTLGDCTIAGLAHFVQAVGSYAGYGHEAIASDPEVQAIYAAFTGWSPADPNSDQGAVMADVLTKWFQQGATIGGKPDRPLAFIRINPANILQVRQAMNLFGPLYIGVSMPLSAQNTGLWDVVPGSDGAPGSWGGHCMLASAARGAGDRWDFITWGAVQAATLAWWRTYVEECWAILHPSWLAGGANLMGFPADQLAADMQALRAP